MRRLLVILAICGGACFASTTFTVGSIAETGSFTISLNAPLGESFVAPAGPISSFGVGLVAANPGATPAGVTLTFLSGDGTGGSTVGSVTTTAPGGGSGVPLWVDTNVSGISLTPGSTYTAVLSSSTVYWGWISSGLDGNIYANGTLYANGAAVTGPVQDAVFRFTFDTPEPGTVGLVLMGLALVGAKLRVPAKTQRSQRKTKDATI